MGAECTNEAEVKKYFVYDGSWRSTGRGKEYWQEGEVRFPDEDCIKRDGAYRSLFGPCAAHNGIIFANSNHNVRLALRRLTGCRLRKIDIDGVEHEEIDGGSYHYDLIDQQKKFIADHEDLLMEIFSKYDYVLQEFTTLCEEALEHHDDPHPKKQLRINAMHELETTGEVATRLWLRHVLYKFKRDEIAKPGKFGRMIGDLGVAASLQGFVITKLIKQAMEEEPIEYKGGTIYFCKKPTQKKLKWIFEQLINPSGRFFFCYFSDDSCLSIRINGVVHTFNVDIASCDASHGPALFKLFSEMSHQENMAECLRILVEQCELPIRVQDVTSKMRTKSSKRRVTLKCDRPRLYSGSTITTVINNLANILIALSVAEHTFTGSVEAGIREAAEKAGYVVTCENCETYHDIQFLKHSPVFDTNGNIQPLMNVGVLLRMSGTCKGDLPGSKNESIAARARTFQRALLQGAYPHVSFTLIDNMKLSAARVPISDKTQFLIDDRITTIFKYKTAEQTEPFDVHSHEMWQRYKLDYREIVEIEEVFGRMSTFQHVSLPAIGKVLMKDYGLREQTGLSTYNHPTTCA